MKPLQSEETNEMSKAQHSPTPWEINDVCNQLEEDYDGSDIVISKDNYPLVTVRGTNDMSCLEDEDLEKMELEVVANAEFVVKAVNCHDELLAALEEINNLKAISGLPEHLHALITAMKIVAKEAINKAKAQ